MEPQVIGSSFAPPAAMHAASEPVLCPSAVSESIWLPSLLIQLCPKTFIELKLPDDVEQISHEPVPPDEPADEPVLPVVGHKIPPFV